MKKISIAILLLFVVVFVGNWIYGNRAAEKLDNRLKMITQSGSIPYDISYSKLSVNPLFSEFTFYDLVIKAKGEGFELSSKVLKVSMKYMEAVELSQTYYLKELTKCRLLFDQFNLKNKDNLSLIESERLDVDFDGSINPFLSSIILNQFPTEKQELNVKLKGTLLNFASLNIKSITPVSVSGNDELKNIDICICWDPESCSLLVKKLRVDSGIMDIKSDAIFTYEGDRVDSSKLVKVEFHSDIKNVTGLSWGNPNREGLFMLGSVATQASGSLFFLDNGEIDGIESTFDMHLDLKDLKVKYEGSAKARLDAQASLIGLHSEDISISEFVVNATLKNHHIVLDETSLLLPFFKADLSADIKVNQSKPDDSEINEMVLQIGHIKPSFQKGIKNIEYMLGLKFPKEGEDYVFKVKGTVGNPQVQGIHY